MTIVTLGIGLGKTICNLIDPITWAGGLEYFFLLFGFGTFGYLAWTLWEALKPREQAEKSGPDGRHEAP